MSMKVHPCFVKAFGWRFTNIVQQGSPTQPDIIRIRANIVYDFQRMIKLFLWDLLFLPLGLKQSVQAR
jgi:hypothetical protein